MEEYLPFFCSKQSVGICHSASERGMTDTHRLIEVRLLSYYLYTELDVNLGYTHRLIEVRLLSYYLYTELDVNLGFR